MFISGAMASAKMGHADRGDGEGFNSMGFGLARVEVDTDKNSIGVSVSDADSVGERDKRIAVAVHHNLVTFFLQHVAENARNFESVNFFITVKSAASRILTTMPWVYNNYL